MEHKKSEPCCSTASVRDCMDKCVEIVRCTAITVRRVPDSGAYECFRKKIIDAGACFASASHDTNLFFFFLRFFVGVCKARLWFFFFFLDFFFFFLRTNGIFHAGQKESDSAMHRCRTR